jgi:hypothetical protein
MIRVMRSEARTIVGFLAFVVGISSGCRLDGPDPETASLSELLVNGSWSRFSEAYYPGEGRPVTFLSLGMVVFDGDRLTQSWAVREPGVVEFTTFRNESRRYRWYEDHKLLAYCHLGFGKPFLMAPDSLGYERVLEVAKEAGVYNCDGPAILSIAGARIERLPDSSETPVAADLSGIEINWQIKNAIRDLRTIRKIDLSCSEIEDSDLDYVVGLNGLEELDLSNTGITDLGIFRLSGVKDLKLLHVGNTQTTSEEIETLITKLPGLEVTRDSTSCQPT